MSDRIILASGSAIRKQILDGAGLDYDVIIRPVDEAAIKDAMLAEKSRLRDIADALAEAKAMRVSRQEPGFVIGADQIMVMADESGQDQLFDKPKNMQEVRERLLSMRGRKHELIGAVVICENGAPVWRHLRKLKAGFLLFWVSIYCLFWTICARVGSPEYEPSHSKTGRGLWVAHSPFSFSHAA